jgi:hypothetical protein
MKRSVVLTFHAYRLATKVRCKPAAFRLYRAQLDYEKDEMTILDEA